MTSAYSRRWRHSPRRLSRVSAGAVRNTFKPPEEIARLIVDAVEEERFCVFNGERWRDFIARSTEPVLNAANPPVITWGPDLRRTDIEKSKKAGGNVPFPPDPPSKMVPRLNE